MKKTFPIVLMIFGLVFLAAGAFTGYRGLAAKTQVRTALVAQNITTPSDASIPDTPVTNAATAQSMAQIIDRHARESTGGRTYAEMGRFMAIGGGDTSDESLAVLGADGKPVANPLRNLAFQASTLQTSLYTSVLAFNVADLVVGLGVMMLALGLVVGGVGVALGGLAIPSIGRRFHVEPIVAKA